MDKLLEMAFVSQKRWEDAINHAFFKGISQKKLRDLCEPQVRAFLYQQIKAGVYKIAPPHTALIPKDEPGQFRKVYINEDLDRVLLSLINDMLFDLCGDMVHPNCRSYQKGVSCGSVVQDVSVYIAEHSTKPIGFKADLSKYFDNVSIRCIDAAFDEVERRFGKSALIDIVRNYYHQDLYFDIEDLDEHHNPKLKSQFQSLKQGCAVASWLADVCLYDIDEELTKMLDKYKRYSDDLYGLGEQYDKALEKLREMLAEKGLSLNPKKVEIITADKWIKFLGFSIKGNSITLSSTAIKKFQKEIENATWKKRGISIEQAMKNVYDALYKGPMGYSWAKRYLRVINNEHDIDKLDGFVKDCLRAVVTGKHKLGGLGGSKNQKDGFVSRGTGKNVKANKGKMPHIDGYYTIRCMKNLLNTSTAAFEVLVDTQM